MTISFNTIPSNTLVPLFYAEMDNQVANTAQDSGASLLIGHANNGAEIVANSLVLMPSADYARQICGAGSQLARMVEAYRQTDPFGELYVIAVPESTGAAATVTLTVTGAATETGTVNVYVGRTRVQAPVTNGDNVATIASSIQDAINAVPALPFTASSSAGVVTLTARHKGLCGNEIPVSLNYYGFGGGEVLPAGVQIAVATGTEDLGKVTFRPSITAYVVGDDCFDQRDRLIEALNKPGPGTLVHPTYGELKVCVDGEVRVSTSKSEGRIVRFDLKFVEAGELSYPTSGAATAQTLMSSCSALDDCISDSFSGFSIDGVADFVQNDVIGNASIMLGYVSDAMKVVDSAVSDAARLLQGDISVLLPPPSSGKNFVEQVQKMWRTGKRLYGNASDLVTMIKTLSGVSLGSDLQPRGVWKTDSKTTATATQQRNVVASTLRTTAISEAAYAVTRLPAPTTSAVMQNSAVGQATTPAQSTGWPSVTHPALNNAPAVKNTVDLPTWEELTDIRDTLNTAIDKELSRTTSDALFLALRRMKADLNADINTRLEQSARIIQRTPDEVLPALVLAATWFDNAARDADIIRRNAITHPGFVPVIPLKVPVQ
ncbi:DNA circularization N-terminal domain-containing protein [Escherichia coli]|nr:DNA circularization N-terminal domain-containing protein [Escherichia coli]